MRLPILHAAEGLTVDCIWRVVSSPVLPGLLVTAFFWSSSLALGAGLKEQAWRSATGTTLLLWIGLWCIMYVNGYLSHGARNNWTRDITWKWTEEVVVITGGSSGIGRALVDSLAQKGISVAVLDIAEPMSPLPKRAKFFRCDLSRPKEVAEAAASVVQTLGHATVLVQNAGVVRSQSILESSERDIDLTYDVNVKAHFYTAQAFLPEMIKRGHGHVLTVASSTAFIQAPLGVAYCSSKAAALSFYEGLTLELRYSSSPLARRVRTSLLCPGHVRTEMFNGYDQGVWLPHWIMPTLEVDTVAGLMEEIILSENSQYVIEPLAAKIMPLFRVLPAWLHAFLHSFAKDSMRGVREVQTKREGKK